MPQSRKVRIGSKLTMPNWCNNNVRLTHEDPAKLEEIVQIVKQSEKTTEHEYNWGTAVEVTRYGLFAYLVPPPNSIAYKDEGEQEDYRDDPEFWYNWNPKNWGTKWEADITYCEYEDEGKVLVLDFDTAWAPPYGIYQALVEQGYSVNAAYMECGMDYWGIWIDGCDDIGGEMSAYVVDKFGRTYAEWDDLEEGSEGKGKKITKNGKTYSWDEYEHEWKVDEEKSHEKAMKIGITEEEWNRCELGNIRGG